MAITATSMSARGAETFFNKPTHEALAPIGGRRTAYAPTPFPASPERLSAYHNEPTLAGCDASGVYVMLSRRERLASDLRRLRYKTPAAYVLLRDDTPDVAIGRAGETGDIQTRIAEHLRSVPWFTRAAIIFGPAVDKTVAHALQYCVHTHLVAADRCVVASGVDANPPSRQAFETALPLFERARLSLAAVGVDLLERRVACFGAAGVEPDELDGFAPPIDAERVCLFRHPGYRAAAAQIDGRWRVLAGSEIRAQAQASARPSDIRLRQTLARAQALAPVHGRPDVRRLLTDVQVPSLDAAGKLILGNRRSMTRAWDDVDVGARPTFRA